MSMAKLKKGEENIGKKWWDDYKNRRYTCRDCPTRKKFRKALVKFEDEVGRDSAYEVAKIIIKQSLEKRDRRKTADGINIFVNLWNIAFYRFGWLDINELEKCVKKNFDKILMFRKRSIFSLSSADEDDIKNMFNDFNKALKIVTGKKKGTKSPVSVAKALHILAPRFFPAWDRTISQKYKCNYYKNPAEKYIKFCHITKRIAEAVRDFPPKRFSNKKTLLKLIDEYNYAKYTKKGKWRI